MSNPFSLLTDEGADPADNVPTPAPAKAAPAASAPSAARTQPKQQQPRRDNNRGNARTNAPVQGTDAGEADLSRDVRGERTAGRKFPLLCMSICNFVSLLFVSKNVVAVDLVLVDQEVVAAAEDLAQTGPWTGIPTPTECRIPFRSAVKHS